MFYISAYFEHHRSHYYKGLQAISREGDWQGWTTFFLSAVVEQAERNVSQVRSILRLYDDMKTRVVELTRSQYAIYVLDFLFAHPLFSSSDFIERAGIPKRTALRVLGNLVAADVLRIDEEARGARPSVYAFDALLHIVN